MRIARLGFVILAFAGSYTVGAWAADSRHSPHRYPGQTTESYVRHLEDPDRAAWQRPRDVVAALEIEPGATVADLGAGSGYFLPYLAQAVGPRGRVLALDADPEMVARLEQRIASEGWKNVSARLVEPSDPALEPESVDLVFLCNVWPQVEARAAYIPRLVTALKPAGRIAIVDYHRREDIPHGPPFADKVDRGAVVGELDLAGLDLVREHEILPHQYFLVFRARRARTIAALTAGVTAALAEEKDPERRSSRIASELGAFLREGDLPERFRAPHPGIDVTTYLLYAAVDGSFSIAVLVIRPHKRAPMHDHQTWTVWGTIQGRDREIQLDRAGDPAEGFPELRLRLDHVLEPGQVSLVPEPPRDVHQVENAGDAVSVSVHIHGADMSQVTRNRYDRERGRVLPFVQSYDRPTEEELR